MNLDYDDLKVVIFKDKDTEIINSKLQRYFDNNIIIPTSSWIILFFKSLFIACINFATLLLLECITNRIIKIIILWLINYCLLYKLS